MKATTLKTPQSRQRNAVVLDSWNDLLFLIEDQDRHGQTVWMVRLRLGDLPPWRYGPFDTMTAAREAFSTLIEFIHRELEVLFCEAGSRAGCDSNEEY